MGVNVWVGGVVVGPLVEMRMQCTSVMREICMLVVMVGGAVGVWEGLAWKEEVGAGWEDRELWGVRGWEGVGAGVVEDSWISGREERSRGRSSSACM